MMTRYNSRRRKRDPISLDWYFGIGGLSLVGDICLNASPLVFGLNALLIAVMGFGGYQIGLNTQQRRTIDRALNGFLHRYGFLAILFGFFSFTAIFFATADASHAQFLQNVDTAMKNMFDKIAPSNSADLGKVKDLIIAVARLVMLGVVITQVIKAVQSRDDTEEVKNLLRPVILMFAAVFIADVLAKVITG